MIYQILKEIRSKVEAGFKMEIHFRSNISWGSVLFSINSLTQETPFIARFDSKVIWSPNGQWHQNSNKEN